MKTPAFQLNWQGRLSIEEVNSLRNDLLAALDQHTEITLDLSNVDHLDLSCIQLLCAACGSASIRGKRLSLRGAENPALGQTLRNNGLNYRDNCLRSRKSGCLWPQAKGNDSWQKRS
jgi:anti-anti-sigma regulatory factor